MIDGDANGTRHQGERESGHDAAVRYSIFQPAESLAEDIEQQRHQTQGRDAGASGHHNAGKVSEREEALLDWHGCNRADAAYLESSNGTGISPSTRGLPEVHVALYGKGKNVW